jgi:hypothetical protein
MLAPPGGRSGVNVSDVDIFALAERILELPDFEAGAVATANAK